MPRLIILLMLLIFSAGAHRRDHDDHDNDDLDDGPTCDFANCEYNCRRTLVGCLAGCCTPAPPPAFNPLSSCPFGSATAVATCSSNSSTPQVLFAAQPSFLTATTVGAQGGGLNGGAGSLVQSVAFVAAGDLVIAAAGCQGAAGTATTGGSGGIGGMNVIGGPNGGGGNGGAAGGSGGGGESLVGIFNATLAICGTGSSLTPLAFVIAGGGGGSGGGTSHPAGGAAGQSGSAGANGDGGATGGGGGGSGSPGAGGASASSSGCLAGTSPPLTTPDHGGDGATCVSGGGGGGGGERAGGGGGGGNLAGAGGGGGGSSSAGQISVTFGTSPTGGDGVVYLCLSPARFAVSELQAQALSNVVSQPSTSAFSFPTWTIQT